MQGFDIPADVTFADDLDVSVTPETYVDPAAPLPIYDGRYGFRIKQMSLRTKSKEDKSLQLTDGKFPIIVLEQIEIADPAENARLVMLYQDFRTKPFSRRDFSGVERQANNIADILRSNDVNVQFSGVQEGLRLLEATAAQGGIFYGRFRWTATDVEAAKAENALILQAAGLPADTPAAKQPEAVRKATNAVWKKYRLQGQKKFRNATTGAYGPLVSQAGEPIEPRTEIAEFIPSNKVGTVKLGPSVQ